MPFHCGIGAVGNQGDSACLFLARLPITTVKTDSSKLVGVCATTPRSNMERVEHWASAAFAKLSQCCLLFNTETWIFIKPLETTTEKKKQNNNLPHCKRSSVLQIWIQMSVQVVLSMLMLRCSKFYLNFFKNLKLMHKNKVLALNDNMKWRWWVTSLLILQEFVSQYY